MIIIDANPDWRKLPVHRLQLTGKEIAVDAAYIMEMLAHAAEYCIIEHEVSQEGVRNDFASA